MATVDPLAIPPDALDQGGTEIMRAFVVEGALHISLRRAFDDPQAWGLVLVDVIRHLGRIYATETGADEDLIVERIRNMFDAELDLPTDIGRTNAIS